MWTKTIPDKEGYYWSLWQRSDSKKKVVTPALVTILGEQKVIHIMGGGTLPIHNKKHEEKAKKTFGWKDIQFWDSPMDIPPII